MSYTVQDINGCTKKIHFNIENVDLSKEVNDFLKDKQQNANLKGFRKGKAPMSMVEKLYKPQAENDALYKLISKSFYEAIQEKDIKAVGYPKFANTKHEDSKVEFDATIEIYPEFEIKDYSKYEFKKEEKKTKDEDIEAVRKQILESKAQMVEVTDEAQKLENGHFSVINFEGEKPDGERPENMKAKEFLLEIGSNQFIPGFEEALIGMKKAEKKTIELTFPKDYHDEGLKGKDVKFHVELLEIKKKEYPEFTDEIAKESGYDSVADFETKTKSRLENQNKRQVLQDLHQNILEKLVKENNFDIPQVFIENQKEGVRQDLANNLKYQGFTDEMIAQYFEKWSEDVNSKAEFQVRSGLILDRLSKKYDVEITEEDFNNKLKEMAEESNMELEQIKGYYTKDKNIENNLRYALKEEKTFEKLIADMKVS